MAIQNDENTHLVLIYIFGDMQSTKKKFDFNIIIWLFNQKMNWHQYYYFLAKHII
jgi:hypothetical protein